MQGRYPYNIYLQGRYPYGAESRQGWLSDSPVSDYDEGYSLYRSEVMVITHFTGERSWSLLTLQVRGHVLYSLDR